MKPIAHAVRNLALALAVAAVAAPRPAAGTDPDHLQRSGEAPLTAQQTQADSIRFSLRVADNNLIGVTITNYGFVGNNFISRAPSLEYPLGSGFEHLVRGGLWIGARATDDDGSFVGVTTAAVDGVQGNASQGATEFTPAGLDIKVRSTLENNRFFNPAAVSELDYVSEFSDRPSKRVQTNTEAHRTMNLLVRQENYQWSFSEYAHLTIFRYIIRNLGLPLQDAWVGFYGEFQSGPKNLYSVWPPSSAGSTVGSWFRKKMIAYDDSLRLFREHYCAAQPIPTACNANLVPYWIGLKLLGVSPGDLADTTDKKVTWAVWDYAPGDATRDEDGERYPIMSSGRIQALDNEIYFPGTGDPIQVLAVGPFPVIDPGDSIIVDYAVVGGREVVDLQRHARFAQRAYDRGYIVPIPPPSPRFRVVARSTELDLYWDDSPEHVVDPTSPIPLDFEGYRVYLSEDRGDLHRIVQIDRNTSPHDTTGFNTGLDSLRLDQPYFIDGIPYHYKYTVRSLKNGFKYFAAVTSYDLGNSEIESLESGQTQNKTLAIPGPAPGERAVGDGKVFVFPNPYRVEARWDQGARVRDHYLWFTNLPERCTIRIFTLSGDLVYETNFNGATYRGEGSRGIYDPRRELDVDAPTLSGRTFGWNMITSQGQAVATGLYLFSVESSSGDNEVGKFVIVKSDREDF